MAKIVKGEQRGRPGRWLVDYRDSAGIRRWITCRTRNEANTVLGEKIRESRQPMRPLVDPNMTVHAYSQRWLVQISVTLKPRTFDSYSKALRLHILPALGTAKVRILHRGRIRALLAEKLQEGKVKTITEGEITRVVRGPLARDSVRIILATLRAMLNAAVEDGIILANPADKLGRSLRLVASPKARQEKIKALSRQQVSAFLEAARAGATALAPRYYPLFLLLARTGMRLGEALALQWEDINFAGHEIRVSRALSAGRIGTPKSGHGRTVDMSEQLARALMRLQVERKTETLKRGWTDVPKWVFCTEAGTLLDESRVRKVFGKTLKAAGLPLHFTPHSLRHSFASLLLQQGESPVYVQRQLGHASIQLTVDTYGKWLPMGNKAAVNRLDDLSGSKVVAKTASATPDVPEVADSSGGPSRTRTLDPLIKSQLLYQLS